MFSSFCWINKHKYYSLFFLGFNWVVYCFFSSNRLLMLLKNGCPLCLNFFMSWAAVWLLILSTVRLFLSQSLKTSHTFKWHLLHVIHKLGNMIPSLPPVKSILAVFGFIMVTMMAAWLWLHFFSSLLPIKVEAVNTGILSICIEFPQIYEMFMFTCCHRHGSFCLFFGLSFPHHLSFTPL